MTGEKLYLDGCNERIKSPRNFKIINIIKKTPDLGVDTKNDKNEINFVNTEI